MRRPAAILIVYESIEIEALKILKRFLERAVEWPWCRPASLLLDRVSADLEQVV